jgi:hypothetical protein
MATTEEYRALWRRVAREIGVPGADRMEVDDPPVLTTKRLLINGVETEIQVWVVISKPFKRFPPILQFRLYGPEAPDLPMAVGDFSKDTPGARSALPNDPAVHYECVVRNIEKCLDVCLHFNYADSGLNQSSLARVPIPPPFDDGHVRIVCELEDFRNGWTGLRYRLRYLGRFVPDGTERLAARVMGHLFGGTVDDI